MLPAMLGVALLIGAPTAAENSFLSAALRGAAQRGIALHGRLEVRGGFGDVPFPMSGASNFSGSLSVKCDADGLVEATLSRPRADRSTPEAKLTVTRKTNGYQHNLQWHDGIIPSVRGFSHELTRVCDLKSLAGRLRDVKSSEGGSRFQATIDAAYFLNQGPDAFFALVYEKAELSVVVDIDGRVQAVQVTLTKSLPEGLSLAGPDGESPKFSVSYDLAVKGHVRPKAPAPKPVKSADL